MTVRSPWKCGFAVGVFMYFGRGLRVFPVPPFQAFGVGTLLRGKIDRTAENVEDASILMLTAECAKLFVKPFGAPTTQSRNAANTQIDQILCKARSNAGDALQSFQRICGSSRWLHSADVRATANDVWA